MISTLSCPICEARAALTVTCTLPVSDSFCSSDCNDVRNELDPQSLDTYVKETWLSLHPACLALGWRNHQGSGSGERDGVELRGSDCPIDEAGEERESEGEAEVVGSDA